MNKAVGFFVILFVCVYGRCNFFYFNGEGVL